jgi:hypothetical protein
MPGAAGVGTFSVTGSVSFASAGHLVVELASAASSDVLVVDGTVALDGTLDVQTVGGYTPTGTAEWPILQATGGITGRFANHTPGYGLRVDGNQVYLTFPFQSGTMILLR